MTTEILNALKFHKGEPIGTVNGTVNDVLDQVLEFISKNQGIRANVISQELHIPIRTLRRYLKNSRKIVSSLLDHQKPVDILSRNNHTVSPTKET